MNVEELTVLKLYCQDCDCILQECPYMKTHTGCTRRLPQEIKDEYIYRMIEQFPSILSNGRLSREQKTVAYNELLDWLDKEIYSAPLGKTFT